MDESVHVREKKVEDADTKEKEEEADENGASKERTSVERASIVSKMRLLFEGSLNEQEVGENEEILEDSVVETDKEKDYNEKRTDENTFFEEETKSTGDDNSVKDKLIDEQDGIGSAENNEDKNEVTHDETIEPINDEEETSDIPENESEDLAKEGGSISEQKLSFNVLSRYFEDLSRAITENDDIDEAQSDGTLPVKNSLSDNESDKENSKNITGEFLSIDEVSKLVIEDHDDDDKFADKTIKTYDDTCLKRNITDEKHEFDIDEDLNTKNNKYDTTGKLSSNQLEETLSSEIAEIENYEHDNEVKNYFLVEDEQKANEKESLNEAKTLIDDEISENKEIILGKDNGSISERNLSFSRLSRYFEDIAKGVIEDNIGQNMESDSFADTENSISDTDVLHDEKNMDSVFIESNKEVGCEVELDFAYEDPFDRENDDEIAQTSKDKEESETSKNENKSEATFKDTLLDTESIENVEDTQNMIEGVTTDETEVEPCDIDKNMQAIESEDELADQDKPARSDSNIVVEENVTKEEMYFKNDTNEDSNNDSLSLTRIKQEDNESNENILTEKDMQSDDNSEASYNSTKKDSPKENYPRRSPKKKDFNDEEKDVMINVSETSFKDALADTESVENMEDIQNIIIEGVTTDETEVETCDIDKNMQAIKSEDKLADQDESARSDSNIIEENVTKEEMYFKNDTNEDSNNYSLRLTRIKQEDNESIENIQTENDIQSDNNLEGSYNSTEGDSLQENYSTRSPKEKDCNDEEEKNVDQLVLKVTDEESNLLRRISAHPDDVTSDQDDLNEDNIRKSYVRPAPPPPYIVEDEKNSRSGEDTEIETDTTADDEVFESTDFNNVFPAFRMRSSSDSVLTGSSLSERISNLQAAGSDQSAPHATLTRNKSALHSTHNSLGGSMTSLTSAPPTPTPASSLSTSDLSERPRISHGKPNLAPKPPTLSTAPNVDTRPSPPPKKLIVNGKIASRTQSMRMPRSPPVSPPSPQGGVSRPLHLPPAPLNPYIGTKNPASHFGTLRAPRGLRPPGVCPPPPPGAPPPPPPPARHASLAAPAPAPAPPPPPPPHHRQNSVPVVEMAPRPPVRGSSIRAEQEALESRFAELFNPPRAFPPPGPFLRIAKGYSSTTSGAKAQAPLPPLKVPLDGWAGTSSAC